MTRPKKHPGKFEEDKINHAIEYYKQRLGTQDEVSIRKAAKIFDVSRRKSVRGRLNGKRTRSEAMAARQRLSQAEESVLVDWCLRLYRWGWPVKIKQLRAMATILLKVKGDTGALGVNWQGAFLRRWPEIESKIIKPSESKRFLAEDYDTFEHWTEKKR